MKKNTMSGARLAIMLIGLALIAAIAGLGCANRDALAADRPTRNVRIAHITDTHILQQEYCNVYSDDFIAQAKGSKKLEESEAATMTAFGEIANMKNPPEIVLISGDLTNNGEVEANKRLAELCDELTEYMRIKREMPNFQIIITPGNHDMYNFNAARYMPTDEELSACEDDEARKELLKGYKKTSVATTTYKDFFDIYRNFGYCVAKDGKPENGKMAKNLESLKFFCESEYWYEGVDASRKLNDDGSVEYSAGFDIFDPSKASVPEKKKFDAALKKFKGNVYDYDQISEYYRAGICTFIAEFPEVVVVSVDGSNKEYSKDEAKRATEAQKTGSGWDESTGGMVTDDQLRWIIEETARARKDDKLVLVSCHFNNLAHFESQDEIISLFVLDNMERYTTNLARHGLRYAFTGHQHANDSSNAVTQSGDVAYDFETGSLISYGSGYRVVDFEQRWDSGNYSEKVSSTLVPLGYNNLAGDNETNNDKNATDKKFNYGVYRLESDLGAASGPSNEGGEALTDAALYPEIFDLKVAPAGMKLVRKHCVDPDSVDPKTGSPEAIGFGDLLSISMTGMVGDMLNPIIDGLYDALGGLKDKVPSEIDFGLTIPLDTAKTALDGLIEGLKKFDLLKFCWKGNAPEIEDSNESRLSDEPEKGYGLQDLLRDLTGFLLQYDLSYGEIDGKLCIPEFVTEIYGGHLSGASGPELPETTKPMLKRLESGEFVRWLLQDIVIGTVARELDLVLDAPIRYDPKTAKLEEGKGFDISKAFEDAGNPLDKQLLNTLFKDDGTDVVGHASLRLAIARVAKLVKKYQGAGGDEKKERAIVGEAHGGPGVYLPLKLALNLVKTKYADLADTIVEYVGKYESAGGLYAVAQAELVEKYITPAFNKNLGEYAKYVLSGLGTDQVPDGASWDPSIDRTKRYAVKIEKDFAIAPHDAAARREYTVDGTSYAYYRKAGGDGRVKVVPTAENGLLPSMINIGLGKNPATDRNLRWATSIEPDVMKKKGARKAGEFDPPKNRIRYSRKKSMKNFVEKEAETINIEKERPGIDAGIFFLNMSHRFKAYNVSTVRLTDLKPNETYYYRLGADLPDGETAWTETYSFATAGKTDFHFLAMTDVQGSVKSNYERANESLTKALEFANARDGVAFVASMGDNVDYDKNIKQFSWWLDGMRGIWANNAFVTVAGNHDERDMLDDFVVLNDSPVEGASGHYFSYDLGKAHFVAIDTNDLEKTKNREWRLSEKQREWLEKDLKENKAKWTIAMLHKGPYTAGSHAFDKDVEGVRAELTSLFAEHGVDLALQGHDHTYSMSEFLDAEGKPTGAKLLNRTKAVVKPKGTLYVNLGTMGDKFYDYIYRPEVPIHKPVKLDPRLAKYVTDEGYLELKETPAFADIRLKGNKLFVRTYAVVDGEIVPIETVVLRKGLSGGAIVAIVLGSVFCGCVAIGAPIAIIAIARRRKKARPTAAPSAASGSDGDGPAPEL